jgi:hypothetical protein
MPAAGFSLNGNNRPAENLATLRILELADDYDVIYIAHTIVFEGSSLEPLSLGHRCPVYHKTGLMCLITSQYNNKVGRSGLNCGIRQLGNGRYPELRFQCLLGIRFTATAQVDYYRLGVGLARCVSDLADTESGRFDRGCPGRS